MRKTSSNGAGSPPSHARRRAVRLFAGSVVALVVVAVVSFCVGPSSVSIGDIAAFATGAPVDATVANIIVNIRMPRVVAGLVAGAALSVVAAGLVFAISARAGVSRLTVVLSGVAINAVAGAGMNTVLLVAPNVYVGSSAYLVGGFSGVLMRNLMLPALLAVCGMVVAFCLANRLNVLSLGREAAHGLGMLWRSDWLCGPDGAPCGAPPCGPRQPRGHSTVRNVRRGVYGAVRYRCAHGFCALRTAGGHFAVAGGRTVLYLPDYGAKGVPR